MRIAMLAPIAWRTPPRHYGPWELVTSQLPEALVARGIDVTLFATLDSETVCTCFEEFSSQSSSSNGTVDGLEVL